MKTKTKPFILPKHVSILGAARSGIAAAKYLLARKASVFVSDVCPAEKLADTLDKNGLTGVRYEAGGHTDAVLQSGLIIVSPGVSRTAPILLKAKEKGIPVWSEIELAFRCSSAPFVAVTGSAGKSTTVSLMGAVLQAAGIEHAVAGNIGVPLIGAAPQISATGVVVAEISSFQLEHIEEFHPHVAVVTNLALNHLDRHADADEYFNAKKEIVRNSTHDDFFLLNYYDKRVMEWSEYLADRSQIVAVGADTGSPCVWFDDTAIYCRRATQKSLVVVCSELLIAGPHNYQNAAMATAMGIALGIGPETIGKGLKSFAGLEHRLEFAGKINNIRYFNDSKSTTAESVLVAISAFGNNVHLIAGGKDKGCDFSIVNTTLSQKVKTVCLIGEAADRMEKEWSGLTSIMRAGSLESAINACAMAAKPGDVIVFSPGCSSFDMFENYEHRGRVFKEIVQKLGRV